jgi:hypothetical protein
MSTDRFVPNKCVHIILGRTLERPAHYQPVPRLGHRIPVYPPLRIRIIKPVQVIIQPAVDRELFAGEAVNVGGGEGAA